MGKNIKYKKNRKSKKTKKTRSGARRPRRTKRGGMDNSPPSSLDTFSEDGASPTTEPRRVNSMGSLGSFGSLGSLGSLGSFGEGGLYGPAVFRASTPHSDVPRPVPNRFETSSPSVSHRDLPKPPPIHRFATRSPSIPDIAEAYRRGPNADSPLPKDWKILFTIQGIAIYMLKQNEKFIFQLQRPGDIRDIKNTAFFKKLELLNKKIEQESGGVAFQLEKPWNKFLTPEGINIYYSLTNDMNVDNIKVIHPSFSGNPDYDLRNIQL